MNPYMPKKTRRTAAPKKGTQPAMVVDTWLRPGAIYGGHCVQAVQLHSFVSAVGHEAAERALRTIWEDVEGKISRRMGLVIAIVADEFKLVVRRGDGQVMSEHVSSEVCTVLLDAVRQRGFRLA